MHRNEPTRIRENGTRVTKDGAEIIAACRSIVERGQYAKINGHAVDLFSASAIVNVYDVLSETNKAKFLKLPIARMASISFQLLNKAAQ